ncbi:Lrp/AsnC family transcriptional regulator [Kribbella sp. NPDC059898]|uniref:Lrp/AsnC family transcriptional regulator n=1 Tax=Kribbella sp. NPDC059898 TaxID=3346995 RepID=UPI00365D0299
MKESTILTSDDRELIGALQVGPRTPWTDIGEALGISGITAARRWERIKASGVAWVTAAPGMSRRAEQCVAYVEVDCLPGKRIEVAAELSRHELVVTVEITTGTADIMLTIAAANLQMLSHYLLDHLGAMESVLRSRARIATQIYTEGSRWRLIDLPEDMLRVLERSRPKPEPDQGGESVTMTPDVQRLAGLLTIDGRASYAELAAATDLSPTTVRRHVSGLLRSGMLLPRTDVAAELSGSPVQVYLWADAPVEGLPATARTISQIRQVRLCATVSSAPSMLMCAWLQTVEEVHRLELAIASRLPQVRIIDRLVVLRTVKRMGRLLDTSGRAVGVVPINIWEDGLEHPEDAGRR